MDEAFEHVVYVAVISLSSYTVTFFFFFFFFFFLLLFLLLPSVAFSRSPTRFRGQFLFYHSLVFVVYVPSTQVKKEKKEGIARRGWCIAIA